MVSMSEILNKKNKLLQLDWIEPKQLKDWKPFISITLTLPERGAGHTPEEECS